MTLLWNNSIMNKESWTQKQCTVREHFCKGHEANTMYHKNAGHIQKYFCVFWFYICFKITSIPTDCWALKASIFWSHSNCNILFFLDNRYCLYMFLSNNFKYRVQHESVNRKCITVYCSFNGFYKVISPTEIVQSDLHCYLDI
jgi:hypothetical protein